MMESSVIISREVVNPSKPTPHQLHTYKLSMLDQIVPPMPVPVIFYYPTTTTDCAKFETKIQLLKRSLSMILTRFYPLAGRIKEDGLSIDCQDEGVPFVVAKIEGHTLSDYTMFLRSNDKKQESVARPSLFPCEITWNTELGPGDNVAKIQVNHFDCGGIGIGIVIWHKVADATTTSHFVNSWAAIARGLSNKAISPNYIAQSLFPQKEEIRRQNGSLRSLLKVGKSSTKRFVFDSSSISILKERSRPFVENDPTRVEVVSALIWKCFMVASLANNKSVSLLTQAVNVRRRAQPPFSADCFGNFPGLAAASSNNKKEMDLGYLVRKIKDAISKIDDDYITRMLGDHGFLGYCENLEKTWSDIPKEADLLSISSWCKFDLYNVDFGWGKPTWITRNDSDSDSELLFMNVVWLMDTRNGDGIEAWVTVDEKYMAIFDQIEDLQTLAAIDPLMQPTKHDQSRCQK